MHIYKANYKAKLCDKTLKILSASPLKATDLTVLDFF